MDNKIKRQKRNKQLVDRMRRGEEIGNFNSMDSFFPPRPIIKKDKEAIEELYGKGKPQLKPV